VDWNLVLMIALLLVVLPTLAKLGLHAGVWLVALICVLAALPVDLAEKWRRRR